MFRKSKFTISFIFLLTTLLQSHSKVEDTKYSVCSRPYNCGEVSNISYPFWGQNRPHYCGSTEQLKLNCEANQDTSFQFDTQNFRVLRIDTLSKTMRLVRTDLVYDDCSSDLTNTSLSSKIFEFPEDVHNITIFYGCPTGFSLGGNNFTCKDDTKYRIAGAQFGFYVKMTESLLQQYPELETCATRIHVLVYREIPLDSDGGIDSLRKAAANGFDVFYNIADDGECTSCMESKGACGTNDTAKDQFSCHCPDGSDALQCYGHNTNPSTLSPSPLPTPAPALLPPSPSSNFPDPSPHATSHKWNRKRKLIIIGVTGAAIGGLLICIAIFYLRYKSSTWLGDFGLTAKSNQHIEAFLKNHGGQTLKRYKLSDIKKMTNGFEVKLGQGGFGAVYKGKLLNGCPVAVKILNASKRNGEEFINEVASISKTSHVNVVTLLGFCLEGPKKALIYEFMSNGSLDKFIYRKGPETAPPLSWDILYQIAMGIARGLEYLHKGCNTRILHFDIKPHNILLDENFCPKISDFGLAKLCPRKESIISMSDARGTMGYVAPEVLNRHFAGVSHKSDVYSYGMMLLEMVGGRKNINAEASHTSEIYFPHWVYKRLEFGIELKLDEVMTTEENEIAKRLTVVGLWCIQTFPNDRPTISRVIDMLDGSMNSLEMPPKPLLSSPTRSVVESSTS
ncbi:LEAF RUST 10 DISEASE-RESISTANCE LOCUS RECEPTOR-LIKE PROTEIN KINASE-like 2.3 [Gastrolobium bilobum]|uniref:LEAF RUST 10 DISEASE-RESISTANCE LOCUS RECEPTOR-LIKE PROTEIN KINASE-like 2.3 n=1 Tax=Gastrolobium bilobum TaxID=150636 RepID=UPI002AB214FF|nr:LEAF RUST 10 DISEASE-RESISTANCE LOCUS RECEPTOR-LIKE PROTEIN KINASE-like 2.3 [Gastrolobium bilobum]